jgi:hypothetical protein
LDGRTENSCGIVLHKTNLQISVDDSLVVAVVDGLNYLTKLLSSFTLIHTTVLNQVLCREREGVERGREREKVV